MQLQPLSYEASAGKQLTGRSLANKLRDALPGARAIMALSLTNGVTLSGLTYAQAARLVSVSVDSISIVANATPNEIEHLRRGWLSLRDVRALHASQCNKPTRTNIEAFIDCVGSDAIMDALDRLTQPQRLAAE